LLFGPAIKLPEYLSLHGVMLIISSLILISLFVFVYKKNQPIPTGWTNLLETFVVFVRDQISIKSLGEEDGRRMAPLFCTFFFFVLTLNLMGMVPVFATATANPNITGALASVTLCFMIFGSICKNGLKGFCKALSPSGVPGVLLALLWPIEFIGLLNRC